MNKKLLVFYNTCGIRGVEYVHLYIQCLKNLLAQRGAGTDYQIILSSCLNSKQVKEVLVKEFKHSISYSFVDHMLPVNITWNLSVMKAIEAFGPAAGYCYIDSGIDVGPDTGVLDRMYELHTSGPYGITAARASTDSGIYLWYGKGSCAEDESGQEEMFKDGHFIVPVGKTLNLHMQIHDHSLIERFGRGMPDIFASHSTEGIFTFLCACLKKKFVWHKDVKVNHFTGVDGGSSGFRPEAAGVPGWQHTLPYAPRQITDIVADPEAKAVGLGYEECQGVLMHDPTKFDADGYAIDPEPLKKFIIDNFYLPPSHFRYDLIETQFLP